MVSGEVTLVETRVGRTERKRWLPVIRLALASDGLEISVLLPVLIGFNLISVPWNAVVLPRIALFGLLPRSLTGLVVSIVSGVYDRDPTSIVGIDLGVPATVASLFGFILIIATAVGGHLL
jgi:hypothetical protein